MIREIEIQSHDRACCRPLMVMDSDEVAQSFVNYHEGYKVRHPHIQVSNDCTCDLGRWYLPPSCKYCAVGSREREAGQTPTITGGNPLVHVVGYLMQKGTPSIV